MPRAGREIRLLLLLISVLALYGAIACAVDKVDLNRADTEALASLPGIGEKRAQDIIDYRDRYGPIEYWDELMEIPGIGEKTLEKIRKHGSLTGGITRLESKKEKKKKPMKKGSELTEERPEKETGKDGDDRQKVNRKEDIAIPGYRYEDIPNWSRM